MEPRLQQIVRIQKHIGRIGLYSRLGTLRCTLAQRLLDARPAAAAFVLNTAQYLFPMETIMIAEQQINQWGQIVAKAWQDDAFKKRLLVNPSAVLKEQGLEVSAGVQVRVVENTDQVIHLTLPAKRRDGELSEDELENVAGGNLNKILLRLSDDIKKAVTPSPDKKINELRP